MRSTNLSLATLAVAVAVLISPNLTRAAGSSATPDSTDRLNMIDQRLRVLERERENDLETQQAKLATTAQATAARDGFALRSADGAYVIRFRTLIQHDTRTAFSDQGGYTDAFLIRRARPYLEGTLDGCVDFRLVPDFAANTSALQDAYLELHLTDAIRLRAGKSKAPFGLERLMSVNDIWLVELGMATALAPNRDTGFTVSGEPAHGALEYAVAVTDGVADGASGETDTNDGKDVAARLFVYPLGKRSGDYMPEAGIGVAASWGHQSGNTAASTGLAGYKTAGQQTFFAYRSSTTSSDSSTLALGRRLRVSPQARATWGQAAFMGEYTVSEQRVRRLSSMADVDNRAWQVEGMLVLTGESAGFRSVRPRRPLDPSHGQWGAWALAGRVNELDVDGEAFRGGFADATKSARRARGWALGLNGYLTEHTRLMIDYEQTRFAGGARDGAHHLSDRRAERLLLTRFQFAM